jgi:flagellar motor switch/type III secretory pathway protein FliN
MRVSEILALRVGSVIATPLRSGDSVEVFAGKASIGAGELSSNSNRTIIRMVRLGSKG